MASVLRMPGVAADAVDAVLADWLVREGDEVVAGQMIATVETEKAAVDIEAEEAGRMVRLLVPAGARVEVGEPIALLVAVGEQVDDVGALLTSLGVAEATQLEIPERREVPDSAPVVAAAPSPAIALTERLPDPSGAPPAPPTPVQQAGGRVFASPLVRKLAAQAGIALDVVDGTGPHGRIVRRDLEPLLRASATVPAPARTPDTAPAASASPAGGAAFDEIPHSRVRRAVARRLTESKQSAPHFYLRATVRAGELLDLRRRLNADRDASKISVNDLVVKAVAAAHRRVPEMNVSWGAEAVRQYHDVDVAVAVATDRGLVTPVVRDVTGLSIGALAASSRELAERARAGRLRQEELEGGTITVTNLGMFGVEEFAAIINPPQAAILAVGAVREAPVVLDGAVVAAEVMTVTLSVDHRPVDGVLAARWLGVLVELLQDPVRILR